MSIGNLRSLMVGAAALGMVTSTSAAAENSECSRFDDKIEVTTSIKGNQLTIQEVGGLVRSWERTLLATERHLPSNPTTAYYIKESHLNGELVDLARDPKTGVLSGASWIPLDVKDPSTDYCLGLGSTNIPTKLGPAL